MRTSVDNLAIEHGTEATLSTLHQQSNEFSLQTTWTAEPSGLVGGFSDILARQHLQIFDGIATQSYIDFLNSDGQIEALQFTKIGWNRFEILTEWGQKLKITSDWKDEDNPRALAKIADIYTRIPVSSRGHLVQIELRITDVQDTSFCELTGKLTICGSLASIKETAFNRTVLA